MGVGNLFTCTTGIGALLGGGAGLYVGGPATAGMASIVEDGNAVLNMFKNAGPYIVAGTLFKGLEQQVYAAASETVLSYTALALTSGYYIAGALAVFGMYKALDPHFTQFGYKKVDKVTITRQEFEMMKKEIDRLTEAIPNVIQKLDLG